MKIDLTRQGKVIINDQAYYGRKFEITKDRVLLIDGEVFLNGLETPLSVAILESANIDEGDVPAEAELFIIDNEPKK